MRVLQIIDSLSLGGAEVMLTAMAPRFRARGVTCDLVALIQKPSSLERNLHEQEIHLRYTNVHRLYSPRQVLSLTNLMRDYDIIHVHLFPAQLWVPLAAIRLDYRVPLVTTEHGTWNGRRRWWIRPLDRLMYSQYERIGCISDAAAEELIRWCPSVTEKITVIPNGVALDTFEDAAPAALPSVSTHATRLVFVGRFDVPKDHATLLRALVAVPDAHLFLVGDGPLRTRLEQTAQNLNISERVTFLGWRHDIPSVLKAAQIYVHSTKAEGFGIAVCEAMAAGLPIVASDVPGLAQLVAGAGILFPSGDDKALAGHLTALIESPGRQRQMGQASLQRARQFSIENTVDGCIRMYESILQVRVAPVVGVR